MEYKLSFYTKENQPYLKHPKWFEFWKETKLVENYVWIRKEVDLQAKDDSELIAILDSDIFKQVLDKTQLEAHGLQIERQPHETSYLKTDNTNKTK
jgi:hypothetical protein